MTEDEAKTKLCCGPPMVGASVLAHIQGSTQDETFCRCIASACMAWRTAVEWEFAYTQPDPLTDDWRHAEATNGPAHWIRKRQTAEGYCGLAGAPQ